MPWLWHARGLRGSDVLLQSACGSRGSYLDSNKRRSYVRAMLIRRLPAPFLALALLLLPSLSRAHIAEFEATLDTAQEVPPGTGTASGTGTFTLEEGGTLVTQ